MIFFSDNQFGSFSNPAYAKIVAGHAGTIRACYMGTTWPVKVHKVNNIAALRPGQEVKVIGRYQLTLLVEP